MFHVLEAPHVRRYAQVESYRDGTINNFRTNRAPGNQLDYSNRYYTAVGGFYC